MKAILVTWREITHEEYQEFVCMIPDTEEAMIMKILKGDAVMTDTRKSAHKTNRLLAQIVDGHSLFCHNHQRNVWVVGDCVFLYFYGRQDIRDSGEGDRGQGKYIPETLSHNHTCFLLSVCCLTYNCSILAFR